MSGQGGRRRSNMGDKLLSPGAGDYGTRRHSLYSDPGETIEEEVQGGRIRRSPSPNPQRSKTGGSRKEKKRRTSGATGRKISEAITGIYNKVSVVAQPELQGFDALDGMRGLEIVLDSPELLRKAVNRFTIFNRCDFEAVPFRIRELGTNKLTVFKVEVRADEGAVVQDPRSLSDKDIRRMSLALARQNRSDGKVGTLKNPSGGSLFCFRETRADVRSYTIHDLLRQREDVYLRVEERRNLWFTLLSCCLRLGFSSNDYLVKQGERLVARIRPQSSCNATNCFLIHFSDDLAIDPRVRPVVIGFALFLTLEFAYPSLKLILIEALLRRKSFTSSD